MSNNQEFSSASLMDIDGSTSQTTENETLAPLPNQVLEALTIIQKYLAHQKNYQEIKITQEGMFANGNLIFVNYEACKLCKKQHGNLVCLTCQRKVCSTCVVKRTKNIQCVRCKNAEKLKAKVSSEFDEKIENLLRLGNDDKIQEVVLVEVENLGGKGLEELIEVVKKLEKKGDKLDREISIAYFYVGKIFYERIEILYSEDGLTSEQQFRKILGSFRQAKDLEFGEERMNVEEIKEKLGINDSKVSRFFSLTLKIYLAYKDFSSSEERIRKAESILPINWLRDLSQDKFLTFLGKLEQRRNEKKKEEY